MPRSRNLLPKLGKQTLPSNKPTPFVAPDPAKAWRTRRYQERSLAIYMMVDQSQALNDVDDSIEYATQQERQLSEYRSFRRDLRHCNNNTCLCLCYCHSGNVCAIQNGTRRYHTHGHKPSATLHTDSISGRRDWRTTVCHDELTVSQFHFRAH